ncbi:Phosphatidylserine decarboxylase [Zostera marina]|uniref:phosphatidylserine decarboxylase n=1 Tax=Zostera marina TaxID=29655 RepID=A0A0K9P902_ZOSMR|nr:Phosphatidylserine decarboxylase [Zostera marina]
MKFRVPPRCPLLYCDNYHSVYRLRPYRPILLRNFHITRATASGGSRKGASFLVPGATAATLFMLAMLHARRLYNDSKVENLKEKGIELEFSPDWKASFLKVVPLRSVSRLWGVLTSVEIPISLRPFVYKAWARAFHTNLEEMAMPLENYASLREFFVHTLKEGLRPINDDPHCLVSPVDGTVLRFGKLRGSEAMIEQVKGFSYSASSLLGGASFFPDTTNGETNDEHSEEINKSSVDSSKHSSLHTSFASPKLYDGASVSQAKGVFYCVIYLGLGDYHRVHSPVDWQVFLRRHFTGRLLPVNERATRTIKNLHVENERVVLEGQWKEGFMAIAAIGATNIGSINLFMEPDLKTNNPKWLLHSEPPDEHVYESNGVGIMQKKGDELAAFNTDQQ